MKSKKSLILALITLVLLGIILAICLGQKQEQEILPQASSVSGDAVNDPFDLQLDPDREDLPDRSAAEQITEDMSISEVYSIMGRPQRDVGSGLLILEWDLDTGDILKVSFMADPPSSDDQYVMHSSILEAPNT